MPAKKCPLSFFILELHLQRFTANLINTVNYVQTTQKMENFQDDKQIAAE